MNRVRFSAAAIIALSVLMSVRDAFADGAVTLAPVYKEGAIHRAKVEISTSLMGTDVSIVQTTKATVKEVRKNGDVVIVSENLGGKMTVGGAEQDSPATAPITEIRDKYGKLVELKLDEGTPNPLSPEIQRLFAMVSEPIFPEKAVMAGGTWQSEFDNPAAKGKKVLVKTTYVGNEKLEGVDTWKLKQTSEADTPDGKIAYEITAWINSTNGHPVKAESTAKDVPTMYGVLTINMKITELKDADKKDAK